MSLRKLSQETITIISFGLAALGGMVHIVWKLGDIAVRVENIDVRVAAIEGQKRAKP